MQHSASATATPPSAMSCALRTPPTGRVADGLVGDPDVPDRTSAARPPGRRPRSFASSEPTADGSNGPTSAIASPRRREPQPPRARSVGQLPDDPDDRRREDRPARRLVVERHVAADDGHAERLARLGQTLDRLDQLPGDVRLLGVAEVQAVGQPERLGARRRRGWPRTRTRPRPRRGAGRTPRAGRCRRSRPRSPSRPGAPARRRRPRRGGAPCATGRSGRTARTPAGARRSSASRAARAGPPPAARCRSTQPWATRTDRSIGALRLEVVKRAVVDQDMHRQIRDRRAPVQHPQANRRR